MPIGKQQILGVELRVNRYQLPTVMYWDCTMIWVLFVKKNIQRVIMMTRNDKYLNFSKIASLQFWNFKVLSSKYADLLCNKFLNS